MAVAALIIIGGRVRGTTAAKWKACAVARKANAKAKRMPKIEVL